MHRAFPIKAISSMSWISCTRRNIHSLGALLMLLIVWSAINIPAHGHEVSKIPSIVPPWLITAGAHFSLIDHTGKAVTEVDFQGRFSLIYFGYTSCPDVCPTMLQTLATALDRIGPSSKKIQPLFISVDHKRDTPEVLAKYVGFFHPQLVGLTGTKQQVFNAAKRFGVRYYTGKVKGELEVGHADNLFLLDKNSKLIDFIAQGATVEEIEVILRHRLREDTATDKISVRQPPAIRSGATS